MGTALAIAHPPETSGLHTFWSALRRDGVEVVDLLVLSSDSEGMPDVCLEALATGAPVLALALPALDKWDDKINAVTGGCIHTQVPGGARKTGLMAHVGSRVVRSAPSPDVISSWARNVFSAETASSRLAKFISGIGRGVR